MLLTSVVSTIISSCQKEMNQSPQQDKTLASNGETLKATLVTKKTYVSNVDELYAAINDSENKGATIVLAPGTYLLNASHPNAGRLELLNNMALQGQPGKPEAVIIDATALPNSSFTLPTTPAYPFTRRTGVVRVGDGNNAIEWITLRNDPNHKIRSLIQTDIANTPVAQIRIAHCNLSGSSLGINIINSGAATSGRVIDALLEDNEVSGNVIQPFKTGIQVQNSQSNADATIRVVMRRNYIHGNGDGLVAFNSTFHCNVTIQSFDDRIEENGAGILLDGGFIENAAVPAINNTISFEAHATAIRNNAGTPLPYEADPLGAGGILIRGGDILPPTSGPVTLNNNKVNASFWGCRIGDNAGDFDIRAFGVFSGDPSAQAIWGNNTSFVYLYGTSAQASSTAIHSFPEEPGGTNTGLSTNQIRFQTIDIKNKGTHHG
jgi:hypothetical protein